MRVLQPHINVRDPSGRHVGSALLWRTVGFASSNCRRLYLWWASPNAPAPDTALVTSGLAALVGRKSLGMTRSL